MKIRDILQTKQQLDEISLKQAIAAGLIGTAAMSPRAVAPSQMSHMPHASGIVRRAAPPPQEAPQDQTRTILADMIAKKYKIGTDLANQVVDYAHKYEYEDFPRAKDILSIVGVESAFNPEATSRLKKDPARGLMQVRADIWKVDPDELHDVEQSISHGSKILHYYYKKFKGNIPAAIQAYNVGETAYRKGARNVNYLTKYQNVYGQLQPQDI